MEERQALLLFPVATDHHDLVRVVEIEAFDPDEAAEHLGHKREREVLLQHREEADPLFGLVMRVDGRFFDQGGELTRTQSPPGGSCVYAAA